jgi:hypothetical protein
LLGKDATHCWVFILDWGRHALFGQESIGR